MVRSEYKNKEATIRIHDDYIKTQEDAKFLLEKAYKLALFELMSNVLERKEVN